MMHIYDDDICIDIGGGVTTCTTMINDHQNCIDSDILTMSNLYGRYWGLSISGGTEVIHIHI